MSKDTISRQDAIDALGEKPLAWIKGEYEAGLQNKWESDVEALKELPSVETIPVEWIENKIARLKEMDNAFASLTASQLQALLNDWRNEQNEG